MVDGKKLREKMEEKGVSGVGMARVIGKTPETFYRKRKHGDFGSEEIRAMAEFLEIRELEEFFFAKSVT